MSAFFLKLRKYPLITSFFVVSRSPVGKNERGGKSIPCAFFSLEGKNQRLFKIKAHSKNWKTIFLIIILSLETKYVFVKMNKNMIRMRIPPHDLQT